MTSEITHEDNLHFPEYEVLGLVEGGMARVFNLRHRKTGLRAVAKMLRPELSIVPKYYEQFLAEGRLIMSIEPGYPWLARPIAFEYEYRQPYLLMEWIDGQTLADWSSHSRQYKPA